jgi:hypothetical protein
VLERALATTWISTLAIHEHTDRATAIENLRRFHKLGGRILYGTDMGNGPNPVGPNAAEIAALSEAGLSVDEVIAAMTPPPAAEALDTDRLLVSGRPLPRTCEELAGWLSDCTRLHAERLKQLARPPIPIRPGSCQS